ncbi:hypothetical protein BASA61_004510 [Batrachochytrium salamandrivorans]|nr:hypothetical protein BASA61_004510 [Batrachochytrium salamandrivorans]
MWIDTAGTLPAGKSANRAAQHPIIMPHSHRLHAPQSRPTNNWSRSTLIILTPRRSLKWRSSPIEVGNEELVA